MVKVKFGNQGSFNHTENFLDALINRRYMKNLTKLADIGKKQLEVATPVDTGNMKASWGYEIISELDGVTISWVNSDVTHYDYPIALLVKYGHAAANGSYVPPNDFVTPAITPVIEAISDNVWKEVTIL